MADRAPKDILYDIVLITSDEAKRIAEVNGLSMESLSAKQQATVHAYATAMRNGRWVLNGDALIFGKDGRTLHDGRKRVLAAATFGFSFPTMTVSGIANDAVITIGEHRKRPPSVALYVAGDDDAPSVASAVLTATSIAQCGRANGHHAIPASLIPDFVSDHPEIATAVEKTKGTLVAKALGRGLAAGLRFLADIADEELSEEFFGQLEAALNGSGRRGTAHALAQAIEGTNDPARFDSASSRKARALYFIKAWNAFHAGRNITQLQIKPNEPPALMAGVAPRMFDDYRIDPAAKAVKPDRMVSAAYRRLVNKAGITLEIVRMTPKMATELLEKNGPDLGNIQRNRRIADKTIQRYAADMEKGYWKLNGQTVKISDNGRLIDGQHRLFGVVRSGRTVTMLVARGIDQATFTTFDNGASTSFGDYLRGLEVPYHTSIAGAARIVWLQQNDRLGEGWGPSKSDLLATWKQHPEIGRYGAAASTHELRRLLNRHIVMSVFYMLSTHSRAKAEAFLEKLRSGVNLSAGDPALALRARLIALREGQRGLSGERVKLLMLMMAWQAAIAGRKIDVLRVTRTENFPGSFLT